MLAAEHNSFTLLSVDDDGNTRATRNVDDRSAISELVSRPPIDTLIFAEDEVASSFAASLVEQVNPMLRKRISIIWGDGHGYLETLRQTVPRPPRPDLQILYLYDGDQRESAKPGHPNQWPAVYLPSNVDPTKLLRQLDDDRQKLAVALNADLPRLARLLDTLEGADSHDWFDQIAREFSRPFTMVSMAGLWASLHPDEAEKFVKQLGL